MTFLFMGILNTKKRFNDVETLCSVVPEGHLLKVLRNNMAYSDTLLFLKLRQEWRIIYQHHNTPYKQTHIEFSLF